MTTGLILLVFLAVLGAVFLTRMRRRMGMGVTGRHWTNAIIGVVLVLLVAWVASQK